MRKYGGQLGECLSMEWVWHNLPSLLSLWQTFIELCSRNTAVNKTIAPLHGMGFCLELPCWRCYSWKYESSLPARCSPSASWEQEPLSSEMVSPSLDSAWFLLHDEAVAPGRVSSSFRHLRLQLCLSSPGNSVSSHVTTLQELCICVGRS